MTFPADTHPSLELLQRFSNGAVSGQEGDALEKHIETCTICCQALRDLPRDPLLRRLQAAVGLAETVPPPAVGQVYDRQLGERDQQVVTKGYSSARNESSTPGKPLARLGDYELLEEIARGGMGVVYKARQVRLNRIVALKMILAGPAASPEELARFRTEGEAVARLQHPNIVQIFASGEHDGRPYFTMEFVDGGSLARKVKGRPLPPRRAARLVQSLAGAVQHAHQHHVLHRDLKPANILLGQDEVPKISDFGLARWLDDAGQTASGMVLGSFPYMAPEQANGQTTLLGPPTDVFGLGAILYECLTGRPPYQGGDRGALREQARKGQVVPPRQLNRQVPRMLEGICLKALAAQPGQRYASAAELERALGRFLRWRLQVMAGMAILLLALVLGLAAFWMYPRHHGQPRDLSQIAQPLDGDLLIGIHSREPDGPKHGVLVDQPGALPVRNGERVHIEVRLNQAAHIALLWISSTGEVQPLYPWDPKKRFKEPPPTLLPAQVVHRPDEVNRGYRVQGPTGLETVLLLVRHSPLPAEVDLEETIGRFAAAPRFSDPREVNWWEVLPGQPAGRLARTLHRGTLDVEETETIDAPVLRLLEQLRPHFELIKVVRFTHLGD